jgi:hypothetical protein
MGIGVAPARRATEILLPAADGKLLLSMLNVRGVLRRLFFVRGREVARQPGALAPVGDAGEIRTQLVVPGVDADYMVLNLALFQLENRRTALAGGPPGGALRNWGFRCGPLR